jgi:riboflavin kinase/FMN adenylyltransferase
VIVLRGNPAGWRRTDSAVAIGVFDGLHRGHQAVIRALEVAAPPASSVVLTFGVHPAALLSPAGGPLALTTLERRLELFSEMRVDVVAVIDFDDEVRQITPEEFVQRYLVAGLGARFVAVGEGFRFGYGAAGDLDTLRCLGRESGFEVASVAIVEADGTAVRSTAIRRALRTGDVAAANTMLGRPHEIAGIVVPGDGRGRQIGVPTANIAAPPDLIVPGRGVYAVRVIIGEEEYPGVANIGVRPTFDGGPEVVEVHLLDTERDLNDQGLRIDFIARLRDERRFDSAADLVDQIHRDIEAAKEVVGGATSVEGSASQPP